MATWEEPGGTDKAGGLFDGLFGEAGGLMEPLSMLTGLPSFAPRGGPGGSAFSSSSQTAVMASPFNVGASGDTQTAQWGIMALVALAALWLALKKS